MKTDIKARDEAVERILEEYGRGDTTLRNACRELWDAAQAAALKEATPSTITPEQVAEAFQHADCGGSGPANWWCLKFAEALNASLAKAEPAAAPTPKYKVLPFQRTSRWYVETGGNGGWIFDFETQARAVADALNRLEEWRCSTKSES